MVTEISNPDSTGGGGHLFEAKVQAALLAMLLVNARIPCLPQGTVQSIRLQAKQAGFATDDAVVTVISSSRSQHRLLVQIKRHATISISDAEFRATLACAWTDFQNSNSFAEDCDAIALVTGPQSDRSIQHVRPLLDWARTSVTSAEYFSKVYTRNFSSEEKKHYLKVFRDLLTEINGGTLADDQLWRFLRRFYMLSYDFDTEGGKDESAILTILNLARHPAATLDAQALWDALIHQAQEWNRIAGTCTVESFSERVRASVQRGMNLLARFEEHSDLNLDSIKSVFVPGQSLPRNDVVDALTEAIESSRLVIVQGAPGSGKSAAVKLMSTVLANGIQTFVFKAQEFNFPHVHQFLNSVGVSLTLEQIKDELSLLPRKLLVLDGAERLLELATYDALRQLLNELQEDTSWTILVTCREAAAELIREHLFAQWNISAVSLSMPTLSDADLEWARARAPCLGNLIDNARLKKLLRLPFILSLAWKTFGDVQFKIPQVEIDEEEFKEIVWHYYVERVTERRSGMPLKRRECLLKIAIVRAKQMSLFVPAPAECDSEALQALVDDGVLIESKSGAYAPAHDVLEDWAVVRAISLEFEVNTGSPRAFTMAIGNEPAMRRGFRLWMSNTLQHDNITRTLDFALAGYLDANVEPVWRDEIAVAVLQSPKAGDFIRIAEAQLLANDKLLYRRLVHIVRTACKGPNETLLKRLGLKVFQNQAMLGDVFTVPVGSGWPELIEFTNRHLDKFELNDTDTVLGLLNDWVQGLSATDKLPSEAKSAVQICLKYWQLLTAPDVYADLQEQQFLKLLYKIPHAAPQEIEQLIRDALEENNKRNYHSRTILEYVTKSFDCHALCTHVPRLVIEVANRTWFLKPEDDDGLHRAYRHDLGELFGMEHTAHFHYFPQSELQGPFPFLLAMHPDLAIEFIVNLVNRAVDHYATSRLANEICIVELTLEGSAKRNIKASWRLWCLYRGMMPGPQVIECALMALDAWFLNRAKVGIDIEGPFRTVLESSTSAATLSVLASVATAYPNIIGIAAIPLLGIQEFIQWDFARSHQESYHQTDVRGMLGIPEGGVDEIHYKQRKESAELPHRTSNLEELAFRLQFAPCREKVCALLDKYYASLPPPEKQSESDKTWRVALHRMDARHFTAEPIQEKGQVILRPADPDPDLKQYIDRAAQDFAPRSRRLRLANWGMAAFRGETPSQEDFPNWREALKEAQTLSAERIDQNAELALDAAGPIFVAACLVRDHLRDLNQDEITWCVHVLIDAISTTDSDKSFEAKVARNSLDGSRPAAATLPLLLKAGLEESQRKEVETAIAIAVTHASEEVRDYAASGVRTWLWNVDPGLAKASVGALVALSKAENEIRRRVRKKQPLREEEYLRLTSKAIAVIRARIVDRSASKTLSGVTINFDQQDWAELLDGLSMVNPAINDSDVSALIMSVLHALLREAEGEEKPRSERNREVSYEMRYAFTEIFARYALNRTKEEASQIGKLFATCVETCPKYLGDLLGALPYEEDKIYSRQPFWEIWRAVAVTVFNHNVLQRASRYTWRYDEIRKLVRVLLFADISWTKDTKEWAPVTENKEFIELAARSVGTTPAGFSALVKLFTTVGQVFLPDAIRLLADALRNTLSVDLLAEVNATFETEILIRKICYEYGTIVRQKPELHRAALLILDKLVEHGSHTGFRLRDFMVSPLPT